MLTVHRHFFQKIDSALKCCHLALKFDDSALKFDDMALKCFDLGSKCVDLGSKCVDLHLVTKATQVADIFKTVTSQSLCTAGGQERGTSPISSWCMAVARGN